MSHEIIPGRLDNAHVFYAPNVTRVISPPLLVNAPTVTVVQQARMTKPFARTFAR